MSQQHVLIVVVRPRRLLFRLALLGVAAVALWTFTHREPPVIPEKFKTHQRLADELGALAPSRPR